MSYIESNCVCLILVPPKLEIDAQYEGTIQVKGGCSLILPANMSGSPAPTVTWVHNNQPINASLCTIETGARHTTLKASNSSKILAGNYKVVAENEAGCDSAEFNVNVKGQYNLEAYDHCSQGHIEYI